MIRNTGAVDGSLVIKNGDTDADWDLVFPIGVDDSGNKYTPIIVDATTDDIPTTGTLSVRSINGVATNEAISGSATTLNRHYDFNITGVATAMEFDVLFQYDDTDVQGIEGNYNSAYSDTDVGGDLWNQPVASMDNVDPAGNQFGASASLDGTIMLGSVNTEWIAGDNDLLFPRYYPREGGGVDCNSITCDWQNTTHWTLTEGGTTSAGSIPGSTNACLLYTSPSPRDS